jgi:hypothetical protein
MILTPRTIGRAVVGLACGLLLTLAGCADDEPVKRMSPYKNIGLRPVPEFLKDTILERADIKNAEYAVVSGYGLVVNLAGTGGNMGVPSTVREYMLDELGRHGFGQATSDDFYRRLKPERVLDDPQKRTAIVTVLGLIPPGARKGQSIDLIVEALPDSETTSLARGQLYQTNLRIGGANPFNPRGSVNIWAIGYGDVLVNPIHLMAPSATPPSGTAQASLRTGTVLGSAVVTEDRPIMLGLRTPELRLSRSIQERVRLAFPPTNADASIKAQALDEGIVNLYVPTEFGGDWEHFAGVVTHLYLNASSEFKSAKAMELAKAAQQPGAPLLDITYCFEGLGPQAIPELKNLYGHASPDVSYAAARAGAYVGDGSAQQTLLRMAQQEGHPFQLDAVKTLGGLPQSMRIERLLGALVESSNAAVRLEAYRVLAKYSRQGVVYSEKVKGAFYLDMVPCEGPPLIYASRVGAPRIAIFGKNPTLKVPMMFTALDATLTIHSAEQDPRAVKIVWREPGGASPVTVALSSPSLRELVLRLGGAGDDGLRFSYADIVGLLQKMSAREQVAGAFVLQEAPRLRGGSDEAPIIPDRGQPK